MNKPDPKMIIARRVDSGVFVEFDDGKAAFFTEAFLLAHRPWFLLERPADNTPRPDDPIPHSSS